LSAPIHFYLTFNPVLNDNLEKGMTQCHEFYEYLKTEKKENIDGHAYWGRMIGNFREAKIDVDKFQSIIAKNRETNCSTHLFITDFQNIWVGKVESVSAEIEGDFKTLPFYKDKKVEMWFKISDFSLLEHTSEGCAKKLTELYIDNDHMDLKIDGLSPFTSGVRYPIIVQDKSEEQYFDQIDPDGPTHLLFRPNPAITNTGFSRVRNALNTYIFPEAMYAKIPHSAKLEIETAELDVLEQRGHNLAKLSFNYIKAFEIIINDLIIQTLKREGQADYFFVKPTVMPPKLYLDNREPDVVPLSQFQRNYSITQLMYLVQRCVKTNNMAFHKAFQGHKFFINFFTDQLPKLLEDNQVSNMRGVIAHNDINRIDNHDAMAIRNLVLGIGCKGLIHVCYQNFYPGLFKNMARVQGKYDDLVKGSKKRQGGHLKKVA